MPKKRKSAIDSIDLEILSCLCYIEERTAYRISVVLNISKATVLDRLKWLEEWGYLDPPVEDYSTGRLRYIYNPPDKRFVFELIREYYRKTYGIRHSDEFEFFIIKKVADVTSASNLRSLIDGVSLERALVSVFMKYTYLLVWEVLELVKIVKVDGLRLVRLTKKGVDNIQKFYILMIDKYMSELMEFNKDALEDLMETICQKKWKDLERRRFSEIISKLIEEIDED
jgi:predicted transcriptional regulator